MNAEEVKRLLPWYAVDALDPAERREVESELHRSAELRRELAQVRVLKNAVRENAAEVPEFRAGLLDEALQRVDALEQAHADPRPKASVTVLDRLRRTITHDWSAASRVTRFALAAQFALIFVMAGFLLMPALRTGTETETVFSTESGPEVTSRPVPPQVMSPSVPSQDAAPSVDSQFTVMFVPEASAGQIAELLDAQGLQIVSGPSSQQAYVVSAGEEVDRDAALAKLRAAQDIVAFVTPVAP